MLTTTGQRIVVRLTRRSQAAAFSSAVRWSARLRALDLPLPALLYADPSGASFGFPVLIMQRLPGTDLGLVYATLSADNKRALAARLVDLQQRVARLPAGDGFGLGADEHDPRLLAAWSAVVDQSLERSRRRLGSAGLFDPGIVDRVAARLAEHRPLLDAVRPVCFLDDLTTKNVLVDGGQLSGIVDVDYVGYGDSLQTVALTRMSLLSTGDDTDYTDAWTALLALSTERRALLDAYTAMCGVDFLSELGHAFNRPGPIAADADRAQRIIRVVSDLIGG